MNNSIYKVKYNPNNKIIEFELLHIIDSSHILNDNEFSYFVSDGYFYRVSTTYEINDVKLIHNSDYTTELILYGYWYTQTNSEIIIDIEHNKSKLELPLFCSKVKQFIRDKNLNLLLK